MSIPNFAMPPEWHPQDWLWIGFPHEEAEWGTAFARAQEQLAGFANAVAESGQEVRLIVRDEANEARARSLVSEAVKLEARVYGDVWLRDTGPLVVLDGAGNACAMRFIGAAKLAATATLTSAASAVAGSARTVASIRASRRHHASKGGSIWRSVMLCMKTVACTLF